MTKVEIIEGMLDLLDSPEKWTRQAIARDRIDRMTDPEGDTATSWCLMGAFTRICRLSGWTNRTSTWVDQGRIYLSERAYADYGTTSLPTVNDHILNDYEDMRMFLKRALVAAEEME